MAALCALPLPQPVGRAMVPPNTDNENLPAIILIS
jgi:hypothetical protein